MSRPTCPGADPDSVEVTVEHSVLTIRAERTPHYGDSEQVIAAERPQGSSARQLSLGEGADWENLTAGYADGLLHVTIPSRIPPRLAHRARPDRQCRADTTSSRLLPPSPPIHGSGRRSRSGRERPLRPTADKDS